MEYFSSSENILLNSTKPRARRRTRLELKGKYKIILKRKTKHMFNVLKFIIGKVKVKLSLSFIN
jgi:hypothetical protein